MPTYLSPGVYIEEIPSGAKTIEGVATSVAGFVGAARKGSVGKPVLIHSFDDYANEFGQIVDEGDAMGLAISAFFLNGGRDAYVARLLNTDEPATRAASAFVKGVHPTAPDVLEIKATSEGTWGNDLYYRLLTTDPAATRFNLEIGRQKDGKLSVEQTFTDLTMDAADDNYVLTQVNGNSQQIRVSLVAPASDLNDPAALYIRGTMTGGSLPVANNFFSTELTGTLSLSINLNRLGAKRIEINAAGLTGASNQADGQTVADAIQSRVRALSTDGVYQGFTCTYAGNRFILSSPDLPAYRSSASVAIVDSSGGANDLARVLRLDSAAKATLAGAALSSAADVFSSATTGIPSIGAGANVTLELNIDGRGQRTITLVKADLGLSGSRQADGDRVAAAVQAGVRAINPAVDSYAKFTCGFEDDKFTLTSGSSDSRTSLVSVTDGDFAHLLGLNSADTPVTSPGRQHQQASLDVMPRQQLGLNGEGTPLTGGGEVAATPQQFSRFFNNTLRKVRDISTLLIPGEYWGKGGNPKLSAALAHCEATQNRLLIIDPPQGIEFTQAKDVDDLGLPTSKFSVLYYPWVQVANPFFNIETNANAKRTLAVPPSPFAAGLWSKTDGRRGVWKAPAGVEAAISGAAGLEFAVEDGEQDQLNPLGVNCIRQRPGFGSVIWGSRMLSTKADPEWRYVPVRRTAIFIEQSIYNGIQWAVFEPNDHPLWSSLRANIESFMNGLFRASAFQGAKASDAYFVRCGLGSTMTQDDIDRGQVIVLVGFAPLKPAEFVIVRIQQKIGQ